MIDIDKIWEYVIAILLAMAGGFSRLLNTKDSTKMKWSRILSELFISGFSGLMILMLVRATGLTGDWAGVLCGISGWIGPRMLDIIAKIAGKTAGINIDETKNDSNG